MADYDKTNTGVLFREEKKRSDRAPDYRGNINVNGADYDIAGWIKESSKTGKKFLSLKIEKPYEKEKKAPEIPEIDISAVDDIPF